MCHPSDLLGVGGSVPGLPEGSATFHEVLVVSADVVVLVLVVRLLFLGWYLTSLNGSSADPPESSSLLSRSPARSPR